MSDFRLHKIPAGETRPKVSIILLDWGCRERFHTLDWLGRQTVARDQYELIWVELYDRVVPEVLEKADWLIACHQAGMYHKHKGYNIGLLHARGDIVTVCDSDAVFPPEFVQSLIEGFELDSRPEPKPLVLMHHEQRSNHLYPRKLDNIEDVLRYDWVELWPNAGACMSVAKRDAFGFGGFDEDESLRGYICGPYELGWRLVNAGIPEVWHDKVFLWHFAHPHSNAKENKESWGEIVAPHVDFHAHAAVEAFSTGRLLPLTINAEVQQRRLAQRRIGTEFEAKFSRMADRVQTAAQPSGAPALETDRWHESEQAPSTPLVTAIVSSYNAERFMRGLLQDLEAQTIADQTEIVIIDSNSPQNEAAIVREFQSRYHNIRFMRTSVREQSHITLNRCVQSARGKYITLACTDDRHRADAFEKMAAALESNPDVAVVYADTAVTDKENQVLESADIIGHFRWPAYSRETLFQFCYMGPQPMWRRSLHDKHGGYDEALMSAGDYELYLRWAAAGEKFLHLPEVLGLYFLNPKGNEHGQGDTSAKESDLAVRRYWKSEWGARPAYGGSGFVSVAQGAKADATRLHPLGRAPLVSIIVPTHNRPALLKDALESIVAQRYPHWEAIVVNDGGNSVEKLAQSLDPQGRIRYLSHGGNFGQAAAKNTGLRAARGEIVCYLDDDDKYLPNHLETIVDAMRGTDKAFVHTRTEYVVEEMRDGKRTEIGRADPLAGMERTVDQLRVRNYIPINVWAHRRECLKLTGLFDEKLPSLEDWELLLRFARHWELHDTPVLTAEVWQRAQVADNVSRKQMHTYLEVYKHIYAQHEAAGSERVQAGRAEMLRQLEAATQSQPAAAPVTNDYQRWIAKRTLQPIDGQLFAERMTTKWQEKPVLHLLLPLLPGQEAGLADTIDSLGNQLYANWRLTVVASMPSPDPVFGQIETLRWLELGADESFASGLARARRDAGGDWLALLEPGVKFEPQALFSVADYANLHPEWNVIYSDSDAMGQDGKRGDPRFRPDFNLDLLRATPYMGEAIFIRGAAWDAVGGSDAGRGAEHYDLAFKVLDQCGEAGIGHVSDVLYHAPATLVRAEDECAAALVRHLARNEVAAEVGAGYLESTFRVTYRHAAMPLVSVIVPTRDRIEVLEPCINSLLDKTDYANLEILVVDNQSSDPDMLDYLEDLERKQGGKVRVLRYPHAFNFSAICNLGAAAARGEYLLLLNNDVQAVQTQWLERMMGHAQRKEIGIVGARLIFPETGKLQHAGVVLGITEVADHPYFKELGIDTPGYMGRTHVDQNYSAVSGACLLIRKSIYDEVRGMDEDAFQFLYGDVDLCLKVGQLGYKVVWTPYATLVHQGAATRIREETKPGVNAWFQERAALEAQTMYQRWLPKLARDPAYNRHLSLLKRDYAVEGDVVIDWDTNFHDRPRLLGLPLVGGAGEYRICAPFRALSNAGLAQADVVQMAKYAEIRVLTLPELVRADPDTLVMHAALNDHQLRMMPIYQRHHRSLKVFAMDDLVTNVPEQSPFYKHAYRDAKQRLRSALSASDRAIVTTEPLAEMCRGLIEDVRVIPNFLEKERWGKLRSVRRAGPKPRVGWAGAQQHHGDLALIIDLVKETADEVDWIFMGMCLEELRPYVKEVHDFVLDYDEYPRKLASLNLDLAVAPLEQHPFNEAKSNLRLLEYGAMGWPVICSDVYPYRNAPVKRVADDTQAWITALRDRIHDLDATGVEGDALRHWVLGNYLLEDHLETWRAALIR